MLDKQHRGQHLWQKMQPAAGRRPAGLFSAASNSETYPTICKVGQNPPMAAHTCSAVQGRGPRARGQPCEHGGVHGGVCTGVGAILYVFLHLGREVFGLRVLDPATHTGGPAHNALTAPLSEGQ